MKQLFTILSFIFLSVSAWAQQVPNGSFETWTNDTVPDYWSTWGNVIGVGGEFPYFAVKDTTTYVDGHASIKLITDTIPSVVGGQQTGNPVTSSLAGLGTMTFNPVSMQPFFSGIAYTKKPDSLYFSIRYTPRNPRDSGQIVFDLTKSGVSIFSGLLGANLPNTLGQWITTGINLTSYYQGATLPDTLQLFFSSSTDMSPADTIMGSTLWVDAVHFDASINVGIVNISGNVKGINAYPNPATGKINIAIEQDEIGSQVQLFDINGREVYTGILGSAASSIDVQPLPAGIYSMRVNSIDKMTTYKGKVTVTK
jgi:hypothetical protein